MVLMLRILFALLALLSPAPFLMGGEHESHDVHPESHPYELGELYEIVLDHSALPAKTGWFLIPITSTKETWVEYEAKHKMVGTSPGAGALQLVASEADGQLMLSGPSSTSAYELVEANHDGSHVSCCSQMPEGTVQSWSNGGSGMSGMVLVTPDKPAWIGLAAADWSAESKAKFTLRSYGVAIEAGEARVGTTVEMVDLVAEARRAGSNVNVGDWMLAGKHGAFARTWTPEHAGFFALHYYADGDARGTLTVRSADERILDAETIEKVGGVVMGARAAGWSVALSDIEGYSAPLVRSSDDPWGYLHATALYADMDLDLQTLVVHQWPNTWEEDW